MSRFVASALAVSAFVSPGCSSSSHPAPSVDLGNVIPGGGTGSTGKGGAAGASGAGGSDATGGGAGASGTGVVDGGGVAWGASPCGSCLETQCATEAGACMIEPTCNAYFFLCYASCPVGGTGQPDPVCVTTCAAKPPATSQWTLLQACLGAMRQATGACTVQCAP